MNQTKSGDAPPRDSMEKPDHHHICHSECASDHHINTFAIVVIDAIYTK